MTSYVPHSYYSEPNVKIETFLDILPEVFLGDVGAVPELAEVADPYVALEAHQNGAVDRAHHGDLQTSNSAILDSFTFGG